jgi:Leucine-rich repeat (LRR) protein
MTGLTALQRLDLANTPVGNIAPLHGLTALQMLNLSSTPVTDLYPLRYLITRGRTVRWSSELWRGDGTYVKDCPLKIRRTYRIVNRAMPSSITPRGALMGEPPLPRADSGRRSR